MFVLKRKNVFIALSVAMFYGGCANVVVLQHNSPQKNSKLVNHTTKQNIQLPKGECKKLNHKWLDYHNKLHDLIISSKNNFQDYKFNSVLDGYKYMKSVVLSADNLNHKIIESCPLIDEDRIDREKISNKYKKVLAENEAVLKALSFQPKQIVKTPTPSESYVKSTNNLSYEKQQKSFPHELTEEEKREIKNKVLQFENRVRNDKVFNSSPQCMTAVKVWATYHFTLEKRVEKTSPGEWNFNNLALYNLADKASGFFGKVNKYCTVSDKEREMGYAFYKKVKDRFSY